MKTLSKKFKLTVIASLLAVAGLFSTLYGQNVIEQLGSMVFRNQSPFVRFTGLLSFQDLAGTGSGQVAHSRYGIVTTAATRTLLASECGAMVVSNATSGTQTFTLPAVANTGCWFTFLAGNASTEILINAAAVATCVHTHFAAVGADADTAIVTDASCEVGMKNTAATNAIGDSLTLISDGTRWLGVGIASGIWASQ